MKRIQSFVSSLVGLLAFCLFSLVAVPAVQAQTSQVLTYTQVDDAVTSLLIANRSVAPSLYGAWQIGSGITYYSDGGFQYDGQTETVSYDSASAMFNSSFWVYNDSILAVESAAGLLSPQEISRSRGYDSFGTGGGWGTLANFRGVNGYSYTYQGGGGGGYLN